MDARFSDGGLRRYLINGKGQGFLKNTVFAVLRDEIGILSPGFVEVP